MRNVLFKWTSAVLLVMGCEASPPPTPMPTAPPVAVSSNALLTFPISPTHDASVREASPNANDGIGDTLSVGNATSDRQRTMVRFTTAAISTAAAGSSVYAAYLDFTVTGTMNGWGGGKLALHRMNRTWVQGNGTFYGWGSSGPSWRCAHDSDTSFWGDLVNNCTAANNWTVVPGGPHPLPYATTPTDEAAVYNNGNTVVRFNVTADVQNILAGGTNHGWMVVPSGTGGPSGETLHFGSSESFFAPVLTLDIGSDLCPSDAAKAAPGQCGCGTPDTDTDADGVADCSEPTLLPVADTTLRSAIPYGNDGIGVNLGVTSASVAELERTMLRFDQSQIDAAVDGRELRSARIELTVAAISLGWGGGEIELFPMTRDWQEGVGTDSLLGAHGASWFCADDTDTTLPGNFASDCSASDEWGMIPGDPDPLPFSGTASASAPITTGGPTIVSLDVTSDVQSFLTGSPNHGWLLKGTTSLLSGVWVNFGSRETDYPPRLVLEVSNSIPPPSSFDAPVGHPDEDCTQLRNDDVNYFVCDSQRPFEVAWQNCERVGMELAAIDSAAEDAWLAGVITDDVWLGASESESPGSWRWIRTAQTFWSSGPVAGAYQKWAAGEPDGAAAGECTARAPGAASGWTTAKCYERKGYVCEGADPVTKRDELGLYTSLVTQYVMCRVARGDAESDLELAVEAQILHDSADVPAVMAFLEDKCDAFDEQCANVDTQSVLDDLANFDPCEMTGPLGRADVRGALQQLRSGARLREDFCATPDRHITVDFDVLSVPSPDIVLQAVASAAIPWIIGIDPVRADPSAFFGDQTISTDWNENRSEPTIAADTGDGLSPFGVESRDAGGNPIECLACDAAQGQICGTAIGKGPRCYSVPVVTHGEELRLRGYNFWDAQNAHVGFERVDDPNNRLIVEDVTVISGDDCRTPSASRTELFAEGIRPDQAVANVAVDGGYFYFVRIFNKNGSFLTTFDEPGTGPAADAPRTVHTCWSACDPLTLNCPRECTSADDTDCAVMDCLPPSGQTCEDDGRLPAAACASDWSTPPRELDTLDAFGQRLCQHGEYEDPVCDETPWWFGSDPTYNLAIVYVQDQPPQYEVRTTLDVVKCVEESGWSYPGEDEFVATLVSFPVDGRRHEELINSPPAQIPDMFSDAYAEGFQEGSRKPAAAVANMPISPAARSLNDLLTSTRIGPGGTVIHRLALFEGDDDVELANDIISGVFKITGAVVASADLVLGCAGFCALGGGGLAAIGYSLDLALAPWERDDQLGKTAWLVDISGFNQRIVGTHTSGFASEAPLPPIEIDENGDGIMDVNWGTGRISTQLLHPMDYTDRYLEYPNLCTCGGCVNDTVGVCDSSNGACYAGRCIGGDPFVAASPAEFVPTCANDPTCNRGFRQRVDIKRLKHSSRYILDLKLIMQRENTAIGGTTPVFDVDPI
jgi:hypothetical protein